MYQMTNHLKKILYNVYFCELKSLFSTKCEESEKSNFLQKKSYFLCPTGKVKKIRNWKQVPFFHFPHKAWVRLLLLQKKKVKKVRKKSKIFKFYQIL